MRSTQKTQGFTLLELAICIIIIGLIVGGVTAGAHMIRSSELQTVATDFQRYKDVTKIFQDKYKELPGDFSSASTYWSGVSDGDGNGFIGLYNLNPSQAQSSGNVEPLLFWQHLSKAQLINGGLDNLYTGTAPTGYLVPNVNIPQSSVAGAGFYTRYAASGSATGVFDAEYGHVIIFGKPITDSDTPPIGPIIKPVEASELDYKIDDGAPGTGKLLSFTSGSSATPDCATGATSASAYKESNNQIACSLIFITRL